MAYIIFGLFLAIAVCEKLLANRFAKEKSKKKHSGVFINKFTIIIFCFGFLGMIEVGNDVINYYKFIIVV